MAMFNCAVSEKGRDYDPDCVRAERRNLGKLIKEKQKELSMSFARTPVSRLKSRKEKRRHGNKRRRRNKAKQKHSFRSRNSLSCQVSWVKAERGTLSYPSSLMRNLR